MTNERKISEGNVKPKESRVFRSLKEVKKVYFPNIPLEKLEGKDKKRRVIGIIPIRLVD